MLAYIATDGCRMRFLREQLDDPGPPTAGAATTAAGSTLPAELSETARRPRRERLPGPA